MRNGEKNGRHKLTREKVLEARKKWREEKLSSLFLSIEHGVSQSTMHSALIGKTWKDS